LTVAREDGSENLHASLENNLNTVIKRGQ
jgi:hypothetical protein